MVAMQGSENLQWRCQVGSLLLGVVLLGEVDVAYVVDVCSTRRFSTV